MTTAAQLRAQFFDENMRDLNRLVFAAEALDAPEPPDVPDWDKSPDGVETYDGSDFEGMRKLALDWQELAGKLHDMLTYLALDDHVSELAGLRDKAKAARLALIRLDGYDPPSPGPA